MNYQILITLKDQISKALGGVKKRFEEVENASGNLGATTKRTASICEKLTSLNMGNLTNMLDRSSQAFQSLGASGTTFQQSMADLSSITGITGKELDDLGRVARQTGKDSGLGAAGAADAFALLASQIQVDKIGMEGLKVLQKETITLAQAAGMDMADAATAMAATINQFGLEATDANRVINVLAAGSKYGAAEIVDLAQSFKVTGATAASAGLSVEQTAGALEVLSKSNLKGAEAGTALRNILLKMQTELKVDFGETGLSTALEALKPKLNDVTYLAKLFGAENISAAQFLITNASAVDEMTQAVTDTSVAQEQAAIRTDTVAEKMKRMQATFDDAKIAIFNVTGSFTPYALAVGEILPAIASLLSITNVCSQAVAFFGSKNLLAKTAILGKMAVEKASILVTYAVTAAQTALNAVMTANPIALVVLAIAGLVAGMVAAYNHCEGFRKVVDKTWTVIRDFASTVWDHVVEAFKSLCGWIGKAWDKLKQFFGIQDTGVKSTSKVEDSMEGLTSAQDKNVDSSKRQINVGKENIETLNTLSARIQGLKDKQKDLPQDQAIALQKEIELWEKKEKAMRNAILGAGNDKGSPDTIGGMEQRISGLRAIQKKSSMEQAVAMEKEIRLWQKKAEAMRNAITIAAADKPELTRLEAPGNKGIDLKKAKATNPILGKDGKLGVVDSSPLKKLVSQIDKSREKVLSFNESIFGTNSVIGSWADHATSGITRITSILGEFSGMLKNDTLTSVQQVSGGLMAMGAMMGAMGSIVDGAAGSWLSWGANLLAMVATAIPQLLTLFGIQSSLAVAENAKLPFPLNIVAIGATVAGIAAAVASIPKPRAFASGGIVYGNTLAQVGEYPGAANNPEVIAPLNKLRKLIRPEGGPSGTLEFRIRGNDLYSVYNKVNHANTRTR